jgi:hypothetical protein
MNGRENVCPRNSLLTFNTLSWRIKASRLKLFLGNKAHLLVTRNPNSLNSHVQEIIRNIHTAHFHSRLIRPVQHTHASCFGLNKPLYHMLQCFSRFQHQKMTRIALLAFLIGCVRSIGLLLCGTLCVSCSRPLPNKLVSAPNGDDGSSSRTKYCCNDTDLNHANDPL